MDISEKSSEETKVESIFELHRSIISIFFKDFENIFELPKGLNFTHMKAAMILRFQGPMTMSKLSSRLVLEKGSFTPVAAKMTEKGLIEKQRSAEDKRVYHLVLTDYGRKLTAEFKDKHWAFILSAFDRISPEEQNEYFTMISGLNRLNRKIKG